MRSQLGLVTKVDKWSNLQVYVDITRHPLVFVAKGRCQGYTKGGVNTKIVGRVWKRRDVAGGKARGSQLGYKSYARVSIIAKFKAQNQPGMNKVRSSERSTLLDGQQRSVTKWVKGQ